MRDLDVTLGFCHTARHITFDYGQESKGTEGVHWVFYNLQTLRDCIGGRSADEKHLKLVQAFYMIQKQKQRHSDWCLNKPKGDNSHLHLGSGTGRQTTTKALQDVLSGYGVGVEDMVADNEDIDRSEDESV